MQEILTISQYIITIGGAIIILLGIIVMLIVINILLKVNSIVKDIKYKYFIMMQALLKPVIILEKFLSHFKK